jgi:hypothetical protein
MRRGHRTSISLRAVGGSGSSGPSTQPVASVACCLCPGDCVPDDNEPCIRSDCVATDLLALTFIECARAYSDPRHAARALSELKRGCCGRAHVRQQASNLPAAHLPPDKANYRSPLGTSTVCAFFRPSAAGDTITAAQADSIRKTVSTSRGRRHDSDVNTNVQSRG